MKIYAVNCQLIFLEHLRYAVAIFGSETIIFFVQLHLSYSLLGFFLLCICSFQFGGDYLFYAAAVLELFRINFAQGFVGRVLERPSFLLRAW